MEVGLVGGWTLNSSVSGRLARHGFDTFFAIVEKVNARNDDLYAKVEWEIIGYGFVRNSKDFSSLKRIPFLFFFREKERACENVQTKTGAIREIYDSYNYNNAYIMKNMRLLKLKVILKYLRKWQWNKIHYNHCQNLVQNIRKRIEAKSEIFINKLKKLNQRISQEIFAILRNCL